MRAISAWTARERASYFASFTSKDVFTSEAIENIPSGWRARETYVQRGPDSFEETFEVAEPGKEWELDSRTKFVRLPD